MLECLNVLLRECGNLFLYLFDATFYEVVAVFRVAEAVATGDIAVVVHAVGQQILVVGQQLFQPLQFVVVMSHSKVITPPVAK